MSGMGSSSPGASSLVVAAFHGTLIREGIVALLIYFVLALVWISVREGLPPASRRLARAAAEPPGRRMLRIGFGLLWLVDGLLQAQSQMPLGLPTQVTAPSADGSPGWVVHLVAFGAAGWTHHPVSVAAAAVWIQLGLGLWLLTAAHGRWSRLAGLAGAGWGAVVWVFGEAFGGIFAPGASWLLGAPGAALLYVIAGLLVALPGRAWLGDRLGRAVLDASGLFFAGMAVLQAWPGRGFWPGQAGRRPGALAAMIESMARHPQPGFLAGLVRGFGLLAAGHGTVVNAAAAAVLAAAGLGLLSCRLAVLRPALILLLALCAADWVLVQDFGVFGGLGTDPNSMIPTALVVAAGFVAVARGPLAAGARPGAPARAAGPWRDRLRPSRLASQLGAASPRTVGAAAALGVAVVGAVPMAAAFLGPAHPGAQATPPSGVAYVTGRPHLGAP
jgi:hypothetical protein